MVILGTALLLFLGWFNLPLVHSTGSVWRSYKRSLRAGVAILWPIAAATLLCGSIFIITLHAEYRIGRPGYLPANCSPLVMLVSISVGPCLLAFWLRRVLDSVAPAEPELAPPPRCEGCGYNLTHLPEQGRCPECGLHVDASLVEEFSRPGSKWSREKTAATWRSTAWDVLFRPRAFYRSLKLRTSAVAEAGFAGWNYVQLPCVALLWTGGLFLIGVLKQGDLSLVSWVWDELLGIVVSGCATALFGLFWCWVAHRTLAALVVSWWLVRNELPDYRWATKVMTYESTFLWAFLFF